jgi:hypothetical protein
MLDMMSHFVIDRIKADPKLGGRWKNTQPEFLWALGADQLAHGLIGIIIVLCLIC